ncbi:MAG: TadE family type IV pilus minor pilin [Marmoricola sp.]
MRARDEAGAVTAEAAVVLPVLVVLVAALAWLVCLGVTQVRIVDAARETARALARSESTEVAVDDGRQVAPDGAEFEIHRGAGTVTVMVTVPVGGAGGVFASLLPRFTARATAVAAVEPGR